MRPPLLFPSIQPFSARLDSAEPRILAYACRVTMTTTTPEESDVLRSYLTLACVAMLLAAPSLSAQALPEAVETDREMVVTANPLATEAAAAILRRGGTAADAMVAAQVVLGLVEPQSSGLGGGAFIVYYDARTGRLTTYDGREKAPSAATEDRFEGLGFFDAWQSGLSVGVPGVPRLMETVYEDHGRLPWRELFRSGIRLARNGFPLTERTSEQVAGLLALNPSCTDRLFFRDPTAFAYFVDYDAAAGTCAAKPAGTWMRNRDYESTLWRMVSLGADGFYRTGVAADIVRAVRGDLSIPGDMRWRDLVNYDVVEREPVCIDYRGYDVCGMGPPSSGGLAVGQILGVLENFDLDGLSPLDVETVHLFSQAGRLAFADRNLYVGDSDFVTVPAEGMLDEDYLESRAALVSGMDMGTAEPGVPPGEFDPYAPDPSTKTSGTTHISIVDRHGNALSMTSSIESSFGNGVMVRGFLLNNELTDFSFSPVDADGTPIANRVQPNKRPRSSMSPTIVLERGIGCGSERERRLYSYGYSYGCRRDKVKLVTGSPGGSRIIGYTAQSIMNVIDFGLDPQEAINVPHFMNRNGSTTDLEEPIPGVTLDYDVAGLQQALEERGHTVRVLDQTSGLSVIQPVAGGLIGGADYRRDGAVGGR